MKNKLKESIKKKEVLVGTFLFIPSPSVMEILGYAGFDFAIIDTEHGPTGSIDTRMLEDLVRAANVSDIVPLVRLPENSRIMTAKALDSGALGIVVPGIKTKDDAIELVRNTKYAPNGDRGSCYLTRATKYTSEYSPDYWSNANENTMAIPLIESREGVENLKDIISVPGIDFVFFGPRDLSMSLGYVDVNNPLTNQYSDKVEKICNENNMPLARFLYPPYKDSIKGWISKGANILVVGGDVGIIYNTSNDIVKTVRETKRKLG